MDLDPNTYAALRETIGAATGVRDVEGTQHLLVPEGWKNVDITDAVRRAQPTPARHIGTINVGDLASFLALAAEIKGLAMGTIQRIYAHPDRRSISLIVNDFGAAPAWRDFIVNLTLEFSPEFETWLAKNGKDMSQLEFAEFIEANIVDIAGGQGDQLFAVASTLSATTSAEFRSSRRLDNGQTQLIYSETIDARAQDGKVEIPREFALGLRLFKNGEGYKLRARLKYRISNGAVKFRYELDRPEIEIEDAFKGYMQCVRDAKLQPVLIAR